MTGVSYLFASRTAHLGRSALALTAPALLLLAGCAPSGPTSSELAATNVFATSMPGAVEVAAGGDDPRWTIDGSFDGFAWRMLVVGADEAAVIAWHAKALESDGWTPASYGYIQMQDGRSTTGAWRRGDEVIGLGFPDRGHLQGGYPAGTLYEVTITHQPRDR